MTDIVDPPLITPLPSAPLPTDTEEQHDAKAYAMVGAQVAMVGQFNEVAEATHHNATAAQERAQEAASQAGNAQQSASDAAAARDAVWGASNFKGLWSSLAGPIAKPATVKHFGRFWLLLADVQDVTAEEPGASAAWTALDAGTRPQQEVSSGTVACIPGVVYVIAGATVTLTAPASSLQQGDYFGFRLVTDVSNAQCVDFGAAMVRGQPAGLRYIDKPGFGLDLQFNTESGWV